MLKLLACLFMLIDHTGYLLGQKLFPDYYLLFRIVGRLAFPIFAYSVAVGFTKTRSPYRYLLRMATWAVVSELVIGGAEYLTGLRTSLLNLSGVGAWSNVMVTFTFAIVMLGGLEIGLRSYRDMVASLRPVGATPGGPHLAQHFDVRFNPGGLSFPPVFGIPLGVALFVVSFFAVSVLHSDYDVFGLLTVLVFYLSRRDFSMKGGDAARLRENRYEAGFTQFFALVALNVVWILFFDMYWIEAFSLLALPLIWAPWPDRKPSQVIKYFFYVFYPTHFALLVLLKYVLKA